MKKKQLAGIEPDCVCKNSSEPWFCFLQLSLNKRTKKTKLGSLIRFRARPDDRYRLQEKELKTKKEIIADLLW